jgi:drug/metabolite transporter (DMT)-like permease
MSPPAAAAAWRSVVFVIVASAAYATSGPLARLASPAHPVVIAFGRVALAAILLAALDLRGAWAALRALEGRARLGVPFAGVVLALHFGLFTWGLTETSLPAALSLVSLEPLAVVLVAWAAHGIRPRRLEMVGVALATAGAVIVSQGAGEGEHRALGDAIVLGAVALYGVYVAAARKLRDAVPARHYPALVYASAAVALALALPFCPSSAAARVWPMEASSLVYIVLLALIPTMLGHSLVQVAARTISPSVVAMVSPGETLGGLALAAIAMHLAPTTIELVGAMVILSGVAVAIAAQSIARGPTATGDA